MKRAGNAILAAAVLALVAACSTSSDGTPSAPEAPTESKFVGLWHLDDPAQASDRGLDLRVHADGRIEISKVGSAPSVIGSGTFDGETMTGTWRHVATDLAGTYTASLLGDNEMEFVFVENLAGGDKVVTYRGTRTG